MKSSIPGVISILEEQIDSLEQQEADFLHRIALEEEELAEVSNKRADLRIAVKVLSDMQEAG